MSSPTQIDRRKARYAVSKAIRQGVIKKPGKCEMCGKETGQLSGHHENYDHDRWLAIIWLCSMCHGFVHRKPESADKESLQAVWIDRDLHRQIKALCAKTGERMRDFVTRAVEKELTRDSKSR